MDDTREPLRRIVLDETKQLTARERFERIVARATQAVENERPPITRGDAEYLASLCEILRTAALSIDRVQRHAPHWRSSANLLLADRVRDLIDDALAKTEHRIERYVEAEERLARWYEDHA